MARGWKHAAEVALARSGVAQWMERRSRPSTMILAYHNIVPTGEVPVGDLGLHLDQQAFADQLDFLLEGRSVVALDRALSAPGAAASDEARVVITFDDAYLGTMSAGLEEIGKRGLAATVFVPPGTLGSGGFWWDRLIGTGGRPLDARLRSHALDALQGRTDRILSWAREEGLGIRELPDHARPIGADELVRADVPSGVTFGAHTWSHPCLPTLRADEVVEELTRARDWLSSRTGRFVDWLAYPYGACDDEVVREAEKAHRGALLVTGGAAERRGSQASPPHRIPRLNVPRGLSLDGLALRLGGLA